MNKFLFLVLFFMCDIVHASHLDLVPLDGIYSSQSNLDNGAYFSSNQKIYSMDGRIVYCVEPGAPIYTNEYSSISDLSLSGLSQDVIDRISLIGYYGYDYPGHNMYKYFIAAQELIWEFIGNNEIHFTTGINNTGDIVNIDYEKNEIMSLVNRHFIKPSFDGELVSDVYGKEIILNDSNNVLSDFEVISGNAYIEGNRLFIPLNKLGGDSIQLSRKKYDASSSSFYSDNFSQDFMFLRAEDVISTVYVDSFIPKNRIVINKSGLVLDDYNGDFIYKQDGLSGVHFGLYASNDIYQDGVLIFMKDELICDMETFDGFAYSDELPNGSYYVKELSTIDGFVLNNDKYFVDLVNDRKEVFDYMINLINERQSVFLNLSKRGEFFDKVINDSGSYYDVALSGIRFGLYSGGDIYSNSGKLLVKKNELIKELVTDQDGNISEQLNIPFGTYYIKELETLEGYNLDNNIYEFNISKSSDDIIKIMVSKEPIINELKKSKLVIHKVDEFGNRIEGAGFKIFDCFDNLIYEGFTNGDGVISIDNLGYGKYYFYEVSAPDGYIVSDRIYEVFVNKDNDLIQVSVLNRKMPVTSNIYNVPKKFSMVGLGFGLLTLSLCAFYEKYKVN